MSAPVGSSEEELLAALARAVASAPRPPTSIEVGIPLSIALGRRRPAVSCGGCSTPLEFDGILARTNARLADGFRLVYDDATGS